MKKKLEMSVGKEQFRFSIDGDRGRHPGTQILDSKPNFLRLTSINFDDDS
jgi:hypothetical protein